jgi:aryl-alcohol dehydrogenase-like predicted oxidoreductase
MEYRRFGNTGLSVSLLGFGAGHIGDASMTDRDIGILLNRVLDMGINVIDTARSYGESENRIGKYLHHRRQEFILSTKVGYTYRGYPDWSFEAVMGTIEESLLRLRTDTLDIVHLHSCDRMHLETGGCIDALERAREQGKIRIAAYSGENEALQFAIASGRFGSVQCSVNLFDQYGLTHLIPAAAESGMGIIAKRPMGNAVWRYQSRPEGHGHAVYYDRFHEMALTNRGLSWSEVALRFTAYAPGVSTLITGTADIHHLQENLASVLRGPLPEEVVTHINDSFATSGKDWKGLI